MTPLGLFGGHARSPAVGRKAGAGTDAGQNPPRRPWMAERSRLAAGPERSEGRVRGGARRASGRDAATGAGAASPAVPEACTRHDAVPRGVTLAGRRHDKLLPTAEPAVPRAGGGRFPVAGQHHRAVESPSGRRPRVEKTVPAGEDRPSRHERQAAVVGEYVEQEQLRVGRSLVRVGRLLVETAVDEAFDPAHLRGLEPGERR